MEQREYLSAILLKHDYDERLVRSALKAYDSIEFTPECWLWRGTLNLHGYGNAPRSGKGAMRRFHQAAHRFIYELLVDWIPEGHDLDHTCRVRHCVKPSHLEPVTRAENMRRVVQANHGSDHPETCVNGHPWTDENRMPNGQWTRCRVCYLESVRKRMGPATKAERVRASTYELPDKCEAGLHDYIPENRKRNGSGTKCRLCHNAYTRKRYHDRRSQKRQRED